MTSLIAINAASNWAGFAINALISIVLTPLVLSHIGDARYGIWILASSLAGYYGLLDLGFRSSLTQAMTRQLANRDYRMFNEVGSTGLAVFILCGAIVLSACLVLAGIADRVFSVPVEIVAELRWCLIIFGVSSAAQFIFFPFSAVFSAAQKYTLSNAIGISTRLLYLASVIVAIRLGYGLIGLAIAQSATTLLDYVCRWRYSYAIVPQLDIALRLARRRQVRTLLAFSFWNLIISSSQRLILHSDAIVIAFFIGPVAVTPFALASGLAAQFSSAFAPIATVFFPAASQYVASGDRAALRGLYISGTRAMLLGLLPAVLIAAIWARDFYRLWIGSSESPSSIALITTVFHVLLAASSFRIAQYVGGQVLLSLGELKLLGYVHLVEAAANLAISIALLGSWKLYGVAAGTLIPALICMGIVLTLWLCRELRITTREFAANVLACPIAATALLAPILLLIRLSGPPESWIALLVQGSVATIAAVTIGAALGIPKGIRQQYWAQLRRSAS